jgi:Protein of unknown function (DUF732)
MTDYPHTKLCDTNERRVDWPDDATLVAQGHEICAKLDANGGSWDQLITWARPADFKMYGPDQMQGLVSQATVHFCYKYSIYQGLFPSPSP